MTTRRHPFEGRISLDALISRATDAAAQVGLSVEEWLLDNARRGIPTWQALREAGQFIDTSGFVPLDTPLERLALSVRAWNALRNAGYSVLGDLVPATTVGLRKAKNLGVKTLEEIRELLAANGMLLPEGGKGARRWFRPGPDPAPSGAVSLHHGAPVPGSDFIGRLEQVDEVLDITRVGPSRNAYYCLDARGRAWVRRDLTAPDAMFAEALGYLFGRELGVPAPEAAVHRDGFRQSWLTRHVPHVAAPWRPSLAHLVDNVDGLAAMLVLDLVLLVDERREEEVVLAVPEDRPTSLRAWVLGYRRARAAFPDIFVRRRDELPFPPRCRALPVERLAAPATQVAERAAALEAGLVRELVEEAFWTARFLRSPSFFEALQHRLHEAPRRIADHLRRIEGTP